MMVVVTFVQGKFKRYAYETFFFKNFEILSTDREALFHINVCQRTFLT